MNRNRPCWHKNKVTAKTSGRGCSTNVVEYCLVAVKRLASPIGADQIEHPMFNRVPFRSTGGIMGNRDNQSKFIRQLLETHFPYPAAATIGITTIGLDQQMFLVWISRLPHRQPPATNCCHRKLWGVLRSAVRYKTLVLSDVVNAVGYGFSLSQTWKVIHIHLPPLLTPGSPRVLEIANQLPFLGIDTDNRPSATQTHPPPADNIAKLLISLRVLLTSDTFVIDLQRIIAFLQQTADRWWAERIALFLQSRLNFPQRFVRPFQTRDWVAGSIFHHHLIKRFQQARFFFSALWRPPPGARMRPAKAVSTCSISRLPRLMVCRLSPVILDMY